MLRKSTLTAIAAAAFTAAAFVGTSSANAGGYYVPGNGYYGYYGNYCRYIKVPYKWDYYGRPIAWRTVKYCG